MGWSKPTYVERLFITARRLLARGVDDGQFIPNIPAYVEFKLQFFHAGGKDAESYQNQIFFVHVRDLIEEIRDVVGTFYKYTLPASLINRKVMK